MATAELTRAAHRWRLPVGAALGVAGGLRRDLDGDARGSPCSSRYCAPTAKTPVRRLLGHASATQSGGPARPCSFALAAHNMPIAAWPRVARSARRSPSPPSAGSSRTRFCWACIIVNTLPSGAALGAYGARAAALHPAAAARVGRARARRKRLAAATPPRAYRPRRSRAAGADRLRAALPRPCSRPSRCPTDETASRHADAG